MKNTLDPLNPSVEPIKSTHQVESYFDSESNSWSEIYQKKDVYSVIHQDRRDITLSIFDDLHLPQSAAILEIGCGAGFTTVEIAKRGYSVDAVDSSTAMVELTRQNAIKFQVESLVTTSVADIYHLQNLDESVDLAIVLGVIPWLPDLCRAIKEIHRVLVPGGLVIVNVDNRYRLNHLLDPLRMPIFSGIKHSLKILLEKIGIKEPSTTPTVTRYSIKEFDKMLLSSGLEIRKKRIFGFGPFFFFNKQLFSDETGVKLHRFLQCLTIKGNPIFRQTGSQYLVLAKKNGDANECDK